MKEVRVRLASPGDAEALTGLNQAFNEVTRPISKVRETLLRNETVGPDREIVAVAVCQEEVVGFACARANLSFCYDNPSGEITEMYVKEKYRRQKAATALVAFLEQELAKLGVEEVRILTGSDNYAAQAAYTANGYAIDDELVLHKTIYPVAQTTKD